MVFHMVIQGYKLLPYRGAMIVSMWLAGSLWKPNKRMAKPYVFLNSVQK